MGLAVAAIGVVFGDIGTSPLYTLKEVFAGHHPLSVTPDNVMGILSLIFWALLIVVSLKYVVFIMRADNNGEGGIMALLALVKRAVPGHTRKSWWLLALGIFGASLFYGNGMITPAISVLSAVEGLKVGIWFGPIMLLWFLTLAVLGMRHYAHSRSAIRGESLLRLLFFSEHGGYGFLLLEPRNDYLHRHSRHGLVREHLFIAMARNAESAMSFFNILTNRVIELGSQVEI